MQKCVKLVTFWPLLLINIFLICFLNLQLVGRLSQEELMAQLPSFLPALFEAFGNQSADVRKVYISSVYSCN